MLCYPRSQQTIFRVGRVGATWLYPNWDYASNGRFNGRWDDPNGSYRVRYGALEPEGALVEAQQRYRADKDIVAEQLEIEGEGELVRPVLPLSWLDEHELGVAQVVLEEIDLLDLTSGAGMAAAEPAVRAAQRASGRPFESYDATALMLVDRAFTQHLGRYVYEKDFAGIVYLSRFSPDRRCIALFEERHTLSLESARRIRPSEDAFREACRIHTIELAGGPSLAAVPPRSAATIASASDDEPPPEGDA